jgi:alpha-galactosidase
MQAFLSAYLPPPGQVAHMPLSWLQEGRKVAFAAKGRAGQQTAPIATGGQEWLVEGWVGQVYAWCEVRGWQDLSAVEWVGRLRNDGALESPLLEAIAAADLNFTVPPGKLTVYHARGSTCEITDFLPQQTELAVGDSLELAPVNGRSSNGTLPFFNIAWPGGGVVVAIGWSGQWKATLHRRTDALELWVGQEHTRLRLHPGEQIRTPRVLLVFWEGAEPLVGNNRLRQLLLAHYCPRRDGELILPPVTHNTWFLCNEGNEASEENQLAAVRRLAELDLGVEAFWLDAGWFEGGWPSGVGSWVPKPEHWPRGLAPLAEAAHAQGMRFVVWFEPERVAAGSRIAREHPEYVLAREPGPWPGTYDGLFNLADAQARRFLADLLSQAIAEHGIDIYRHDFNIDPLAFWRAADQPEREGLTEIRYVEGFYELWDELRRRHPHIFIDNCASGGRRIDLETIARSLPLWRSDTQCAQRPQPIHDQVQTAGLTRWVPLHSAGVWAVDPYHFWSVAQTGVNLCFSLSADNFDAAAARQRIGELKRWRPLWLGNFWPLTAVTTSEADWCAWQLHDSQRGAGLVMAFRRAQAPEAIELRLHEIDAKANYMLRDELTGQAEEVSGEVVAHLRVEADAQPAVRLLSYWRL